MPLRPPERVWLPGNYSGMIHIVCLKCVPSVGQSLGVGQSITYSGVHVSEHIVRKCMPLIETPVILVFCGKCVCALIEWGQIG